jgi:hypothetical protein
MKEEIQKHLEHNAMRDLAYKIGKKFGEKHNCMVKKRDSDMIFGGADIYDDRDLEEKPLHVASVVWGDSKLKVVTICGMRYVEYNIGDPEVFDKMNDDLEAIQENNWSPDNIRIAGELQKLFEVCSPQEEVLRDVQAMIFLNTYKD